MTTLDSNVLAHAQARLGALYGHTFDDVEPIVTGRNNRLLHLRSAGGHAVVVKHYVRDDRQRLQREFGVLRFLRGRLGRLVPEAIFADPDRNYGIYSFETGMVKHASDLSLTEVDAMARCAASLHAITPDTDGCPDFPPAVAAAFSVDERLRLIDHRLDRFTADAPKSRDPAVRSMATRIPVRPVIDELIARVLTALPSEVSVRSVPRAAWGLSNADFAPQNILVRPDGSVCAVDWEYAGWDDPARLVVGFVTHVRSLGLPPGHVSRFLETYAAVRRLPEIEVARIAGLRLLNEIEWATIHLEGLTEERLQRFLHARPDADPHEYFAEQIADFESRLARVRVLLG